METRLCLTVTVPEGTMIGKSVVSMARWENDQLIQSAIAYKGEVVTSLIMDGANIYPWVLAILRAVANDAHLNMLEAMERGEVLLLEDATMPLF